MGENETRFLSLSGQGFQLIRGTVMAEKKEFIRIRGARENNLKALNVDIPRNQFVVFTGLSGSGKSSLAFDTIYAEGQRRYMESLSSYARQFLGQMEKPDVESIEGLSPAISIDQKTTSKNPRSTVGTVTEIYDYLRLLYARVGVPHCPKCGREIRRQTVDEIADRVMAMPEGSKIQILAPVVRGRKGEHAKELENARKQGYVRVRIDGNIYDLSEEIKLEKNKKHSIEIVVDRLVVKEGMRSRLADSIETAAAVSGGTVTVDVIGGEELQFSQSFACEEHGVSIPELTPTMFSFNSPFGACPTCTGLGIFMKVDPQLVINDESKSLLDGAIRASGWGVNSWFYPDSGSIATMYYNGLADYYGFDINTPYKDLSDEVKHAVLYGTNGVKLKLKRSGTFGGGQYEAPFEGVINNLERRYKETTSDYARAEIESYMTERPCPDCRGARLKPEYLAVTVGGKSIKEFCDLSVTDELAFLNTLTFGQRDGRSLSGNPQRAEIIDVPRVRLAVREDIGIGSGRLVADDFPHVAQAPQALDVLVGQRQKVSSRVVQYVALRNSHLAEQFRIDRRAVGPHIIVVLPAGYLALRLAVDPYFRVLDPDRVAGQSDAALHVVVALVDRTVHDLGPLQQHVASGFLAVSLLKLPQQVVVAGRGLHQRHRVAGRKIEHDRIVALDAPPPR